MRLKLGWLPLWHGFFLLSFLVLRGGLAFLPDEIIEQGAWGVYDRVSSISDFTLLAFVPLPFWWLTAALARTSGAAAAALLPWILFGGLYGGLFWPLWGGARDDGGSTAGAAAVRVMTFNITGVDRDVGPLLETIRQAGADVVIVQELSSGLAQALGSRLEETYPYRRLRPAEAGLGAGIWSRYVIADEEVWPGSRRGAQWQHVTLSVGGRTLHVVNLHLTAPVPPRFARGLVRTAASSQVAADAVQSRSREVTALVPRLRALAQSPDPLVVGGDLNLTDQAPDYQRLLGARPAGARLVDAYRLRGWGLGHTFPAPPLYPLPPSVVPLSIFAFGRQFVVPGPVLRLDHVLCSPDVVVRRARVWPTWGGSDHLPVVVDLVLPPLT